MTVGPFDDVAREIDEPEFLECPWIPGDAAPACDFDKYCPVHGLCVACGEPWYVGTHGYGSEYGGCV